MTAALVSPRLDLRDSYIALVAEFVAAGEPLVPFPLRYPADDFPAFVRNLEDCARGLGLAEGFVPHETFWLVDEAGTVVAVANLRLKLNDALHHHGGHIGFGVRPSARRRGHATELLRQMLAVARSRGIERVLVTCDRGNLGSAQAIRRNGGVLESEALLPDHADVTQRYWIALA